MYFVVFKQEFFIPFIEARKSRHDFFFFVTVLKVISRPTYSLFAIFAPFFQSSFLLTPHLCRIKTNQRNDDDDEASLNIMCSETYVNW